MAVKWVTPEEFKKQGVKPGTKERFMVKVGELTTGNEVGIPVVVVKGKKDGPSAFIGAGTHPEETGSIEGVKRFGARINPDEVTGTLIVVPLQNPPAWVFRARRYPLDGPSAGDFGSRGEPDGSLTARVLYVLAECIATDVNFHVDIHTNGLDGMQYPYTSFATIPDEPAEKRRKRLELSHKIGNEIIRMAGLSRGADGLMGILNRQGKCITAHVEAGEGWRNLEPFPSIILRGIRNFCKAAGVMSGKPEMPSIQIEIPRWVDITANKGGMTNLLVKCGDYVHSGDVVAVVRDMFDEVVHEAVTPISGIMVRCALLPTVATGGRICAVYETDREKEWKNRIVPELERQITFSGTNRSRNG